MGFTQQQACLLLINCLTTTQEEHTHGWCKGMYKGTELTTLYLSRSGTETELHSGNIKLKQITIYK